MFRLQGRGTSSLIRAWPDTEPAGAFPSTIVISAAFDVTIIIIIIIII